MLFPNPGLVSSLPVSLQSRALSILRRPGLDAHVYLPGANGVSVSGLTAGNYTDNTFGTLSSVDGLVGGVHDAVGVIDSTASGAARPTLRRGAYNLLTYSNTFSNASWAAARWGGSATVTPNDPTFLSPTGSQTVTKVVATSGGSGLGQSVTLTAGVPYTFSAWVNTPVDTATLRIATLSVGGGIVASTNITAGSSLNRCSVTYTPSVTQTYYIGVADNFALQTFYIWGAQLEVGTTASAYSPTTTTAASNPNAGQYSFEFAGAQSLALGSVPFQMQDDHAVIAAVRCDSGAGDRTIFAIRSTVAANPVVGSLDISGGYPRAVWRDDAGTIVLHTGVALSVGIPVVLACRQVGNVRELWINGVRSGTNTTVLGACTPNAAAVGVSMLATPASYMLGAIGQVVPIKGTLTDAELITEMRLVAQNFPNGPVF